LNGLSVRHLDLFKLAKARLNSDVYSWSAPALAPQVKQAQSEGCEVFILSGGSQLFILSGGSRMGKMFVEIIILLCRLEGILPLSYTIYALNSPLLLKFQF